MSDYIFVFDLDSTITKVEILPEIAKIIEKENELLEITEKTMQGDIPFEDSFIERVKLLKDIDVSVVNDTISKIPLNSGITQFIIENIDQCYIATGNLDVWIEGLIQKIHMTNRCFCSKSIIKNNKIEKIRSIVNKGEVVSQFNKPVIAIGDGANDVEMMKNATIGIGFGGVRKLGTALLESVDFAVYDDQKIYELLISFL